MADPRFQGYRLDLASVVLVDDNPHMLRLIAMILRGLSIRRVAQYTNAPDALAFMREQSADLVITDHHMDILSGIEFARLLRYDEDSPDRFVPILMVTGYGDVETVKEARDAGINEFLVKPISAKALYLRLLEVINKPRPFIHSPSFFGPDRRRQVLPFEGHERRVQGPMEVPETGDVARLYPIDPAE